jgi:hypothetical protein
LSGVIPIQFFEKEVEIFASLLSIFSLLLILAANVQKRIFLKTFNYLFPVSSSG